MINIGSHITLAYHGNISDLATGPQPWVTRSKVKVIHNSIIRLSCMIMASDLRSDNHHIMAYDHTIIPDLIEL